MNILKELSSKIYLIVLEIFSVLICFLFALNMENPRADRFYLFVLLFLTLLIGMSTKELNRIRKSRFYSYGFLVDAVILFILESSSKYLINYYLHIIYLVLIISCGVNVSKKKGAVVNSIIFFISAFKFLRLVQFNPTSTNISICIFNFFTFILTIIIIYYAKYQAEEKERIRVLYFELKCYSGKVRELTIAEERSRIAMEIHDTIGHHMTGLISELEMCKRLINKDNEGVERLLKDAALTARSGLVDIRRAVDALKPDNFNIISIREMIKNYSIKSGLDINLSIGNENIYLSPAQTTVIYRIIQEALTNSTKHSNVTRVDIEIERSTESIGIHIGDNGSSKGEYIEGNGLKGIRTRINSLGGTVRFLCDNGFNIDLSIPCAREV